MNNPRIIPASTKLSAVDCQILIDGQSVPETVELVSVETQHEVNRIPAAYLLVRDGEVAKEDFETSNLDIFVPGKEITIKTGYVGDQATIFTGIIVKIGLSVRSHAHLGLKIECKEAAVKMTVGRKSRFFMEQKDSDVIRKIITEYGLGADVDETSAVHAELVQYHATDWDFLLSRASANGLLVFVKAGKVTVRPPDLSGEPDLSIVLGDSVFELDAEIDARHQHNAVTAYAWDYSEQQVQTKSGNPGPANPQGNFSESALAEAIGLENFELRHPGKIESHELKSWADSKFVNSSLAKVVGRAKIPGFASISPGDLVQLQGAGERFSGIAFVGAVRNEIVTGTWRTDLRFGLRPGNNPEREPVRAESAAGLLPGMRGLQIGVASALEGDPKGEERILVKFPLIDAEADGIWARWLSPDAGNGRGVFFRPEIGDELIVGFLNQDPRDPIVLGMVHSSKKPSPIRHSDDNHEKGIVTRSKMRLHFDDEKSVVTVDTPAGNSIVLDDNQQLIALTDQHGNSITMNSDGISLDASNVFIKAKQAIQIDAGTSIKSSSGTATEIKAKTQMTAAGQAGTEISSSGIVTVKGPLVQIN